MKILLLLLLAVCASARADSVQRIVVTLKEYNACDISLPSDSICAATVAKCYGRRLVLNVQGCTFDPVPAETPTTDGDGLAAVREPINKPLAPIEAWVKTFIPVFEAVEEDAPFSPMTQSNKRRQEVQAQEVSSAPESTVNQWNLNMISLPGLWSTLNTYGEGKTVAVLDSGVAESALPAFGNRILPGYDFISDAELGRDGDAGRDANYYDPGDGDASCGLEDSWHGTKVMSVLAANYSGFTGVAPAANILPVRVLGKCSLGFASDVADAIIWASGGQINGLATSASKTADVIVMAFAGIGTCPTFMQTAVDLAVSNGILLYAAAGNDPSLYAGEHFPANCHGVVSVGALTSTSEVASYSSMEPNLFMPGGDVQKGIPCLGSDPSVVLSCRGTSMAVSHAGGLAALQAGLPEVWMVASAGHLLTSKLYNNKGTTSQYANEQEEEEAGLVVAAAAAGTSCYAGPFSCTINICWLDVGAQVVVAPPTPVPAGYIVTWSDDDTGFPTYPPSNAIYPSHDLGAEYNYFSLFSCNGYCGASYISDSTYKGIWIQVQMPLPVAISIITIGKSIATWANTQVQAYRLYAKLGSSGAWTMLTDVSDTQYSGSVHVNCFSNTAQYDYYAVVVSKSGMSNNFMMVRSLRFYLTPVAQTPAPCSAGTAGPGNGVCTSCTNGTYSYIGSTSTCTQCPKGSYSGPSATSCTQCPPGKYSGVLAATLSSTCVDCPRGTYAQASGTSACTACSAGSYSDLLGAMMNATCVKCPAGTFSNAAGSTTCTTCTKGSFNPVSGSTTCTTCPLGTASTTV